MSSEDKSATWLWRFLVVLFLLTMVNIQMNGQNPIRQQQQQIPCIPGIALTADIDNVSCFGYSDGAIDLTISGGHPPYRINWSNGAKTEDIHNLSSGIYTVTVKDIFNCSASATYHVVQPDQLSVSFVRTNSICASQVDGCLIIDGGTPPYMVWVFQGPLPNNSTPQFPANGPPFIPNATPANIQFTLNSTTPQYMLCAQDIPAGQYLVLVVDDNGCYKLKRIDVPAANPLVISGVVSDVSCHGGSDGSVDITVGGGTPPYSYVWSDGSTGEDLLNVSAGTYSVVVYDQNQCSITATFTVAQPPALTITTILSYPICGGQPSGCAYISGGTGPYQIWVFYGPPISNPQVDLSGTHPQIPGTQVSNTAFTHPMPVYDTLICGQNIPNGTYYILVIDANGCYELEIVHIQGVPFMTLSADITDVSCHGGHDGGIDLTVHHGTPPYTFVWSNGDTTEDIDQLSAGIYAITVTDANGCTVSSSFRVKQPRPLHVSFLFSYPICGGQPSGCAYISGGTPPYHIWVFQGVLSQTNPNVHVNTLPPSIPGLTLVPSIHFVSTSPNADSILCANNIPNGVYYVLIVDDNGCWILETVTIQGVPFMRLKGDVDHVSCAGGNDGAIDLTVVNGTAPYSFLWSSGDTTEDISNLAKGLYSVTVTDANGCTASESWKVRQPDSLELNLNFHQYGFYACVSPSGGVGPYSVMWFRLPNMVVITPGTTPNCVYNLSAGIYMVKVTDANGCTKTEIFIIDPMPPCLAGEALVNPDTILSGQSTTFSLHYYVGSSFQWQFRTSFTGWIDIPGATSPTYHTPAIYSGSDKDIYVRCKVYCQSTIPLFSSPDTLHVIAVPNQRVSIADEALFGTNYKSKGSDDGATASQTWQDIYLYPSVGSGAFSVVIEGEFDGNTYLEVVDLTGRSIYKTMKENLIDGSLIQVSLDDAAQGLYVVRIENNGRVFTRKVIIQ